jgi:hypothetical protein
MRLEGKHVFLLVHAENDGLADLVFYIKPLHSNNLVPAKKK